MFRITKNMKIYFQKLYINDTIMVYKFTIFMTFLTFIVLKKKKKKVV